MKNIFSHGIIKKEGDIADTEQAIAYLDRHRNELTREQRKAIDIIIGEIYFGF